MGQYDIIGGTSMIYFDEKEQKNKWKRNKFVAIHHLIGPNFTAIGDVVEYYNGVTPPTDAEIESEMDRLEAEYNALAWERSRQEEYPSIQECVHAILDNQLDALQAKRASIKTKYPKG